MSVVMDQMLVARTLHAAKRRLHTLDIEDKDVHVRIYPQHEHDHHEVRQACDGQVNRRSVALLLGLGSISLLSACVSSDPDATADQSTSQPTVGKSGREALTVYKDQACGCCNGWVDHIRENDFPVTVTNTDALHRQWRRKDIELDLQSCHIALNEDGDAFVGHVPARFIRQYLASRPKGARGLSVPAMPVGAPGMEQGNEFHPYEVLLITPGKPRVVARVNAPSQQT